MFFIPRRGNFDLPLEVGGLNAFNLRWLRMHAWAHTGASMPDLRYRFMLCRRQLWDTWQVSLLKQEKICRDKQTSYTPDIFWQTAVAPVERVSYMTSLHNVCGCLTTQSQLEWIGNLAASCHLQTKNCAEIVCARSLPRTLLEKPTALPQTSWLVGKGLTAPSLHSTPPRPFGSRGPAHFCIPSAAYDWQSYKGLLFIHSRPSVFTNFVVFLVPVFMFFLFVYLFNRILISWHLTIH